MIEIYPMKFYLKDSYGLPAQPQSSHLDSEKY